GCSSFHASASQLGIEPRSLTVCPLSLAQARRSCAVGMCGPVGVGAGEQNADADQERGGQQDNGGRLARAHETAISFMGHRWIVPDALPSSNAVTRPSILRRTA